MNLVFFLAAIITILLRIVPSYLKVKERNKPLSVAIKCSGTLIAIVFGIVGVITFPSFNRYWILAGLILGLLGDFLLEYIIPLGGIAFFFGNVIYLSRLLLVTRIHCLQILLFLIVLISLYFQFRVDFKNFGNMRYLFLLYAVLVTFMASTSIPYLFMAEGRDLLFGFGVFLFAVSDYLLGYRVLYQAKPPFHQISLSTYYMAQLCIGISIYIPNL